ncbi:putative ribosomal protein S19e [Helianthus anomalus]
MADDKVPEWTDIVKTATFKGLAPNGPDWYYIRAASIAMKIYSSGLSIGAFQRVYGGRKRNCSAPSHFCKSSGGIIRQDPIDKSSPVSLRSRAVDQVSRPA